MQSVLSSRPRQAGLAAAFLAAGFIGALGPLSATGPAAAQSLFGRQVTVQFATADGKPIADAEVRVFAPGRPSQPALVGRTDKGGKFEFPADSDGLWSAEAHSGSEIARVTVRVGGAKESEPLSPAWLIGGLLLLLILAFAFRMARARSRRPVNPPGSPPQNPPEP
jgi:hypothetical protein